MTLYIDGLPKTIQTIVARHRETVLRLELTCEDLAHFARSQDEAVRARARQARQNYRPPTT